MTPTRNHVPENRQWIYGLPVLWTVFIAGPLTGLALALGLATLIHPTFTDTVVLGSAGFVTGEATAIAALFWLYRR